MTRVQLAFAAVAITLVSTIGLNFAWTAIEGEPLPVHGLIALSLGIFGTVALAWGLMALAFRSDREGWDERADRTGGADLRDRDGP
ncbi:MAG: hypothetical protein Q8K90_04655 [Brevundimonas sp.]|uniref:hypothetical protein n=1 Tax=Brevundimonas sp. TaxID=1871086 RepID=UPI0027783885|nr:hypothetical protein [Brevundimonas sp.]